MNSRGHHTYRVSNHRLDFSYALVCKGHACHILFSYIIMKSRHETNCWSWFWVYKFDQKWKILKIQKKFFFFWIFKIFHFWSNLYTHNHNQQFVSCLDSIIIYEKSMWHACPLHTKAYEKCSLWLDALYQCFLNFVKHLQTVPGKSGLL